MKRRILFVLGCIGVALALTAASASAADVTLGAGSCFFAGGGKITEPAGSTITIRFGDSEVNRGMLEDFLHAQSTTLTLNGGSPIDVSSIFGPPTQEANGTWQSTWTYPTGITLANAGDTLTFTITVTFSHVIAEETNGPVGLGLGFPPGPPIFSAPGVYFAGSCTVTAA
jgi:hypothetical protein